MNWKKVDVKRLRVDFVFSEPREFDLSSWKHHEIAFERTPEEVDYDAFVPMMNYIYPCRQDLSEDQMREIAERYNITFVRITDERCAEYDEIYMALTGAGMDFTWDIAAAYVMQGCLPPLMFCRLPMYAGMRMNTERRKILAACKESIRWAEGTLRALKLELRKVRAWLIEQSK